MRMELETTEEVQEMARIRGAEIWCLGALIQAIQQSYETMIQYDVASYICS